MPEVFTAEKIKKDRYLAETITLSWLYTSDTNLLTIYKGKTLNIKMLLMYILEDKNTGNSNTSKLYLENHLSHKTNIHYLLGF